MRQYLLTPLVVIIYFCSSVAQTEVPILDFDGFKPYLQHNNDTVYILNFWATWCRPCIEEMQYFEQLGEDTFSTPHKVVLVSLDFKNQIESKLIPFIEDNQIKNEVVALCDPDANAWIDQVHSSWTGAIPATIIYRREKRIFFGEQIENYDQLKKMISDF